MSGEVGVWSVREEGWVTGVFIYGSDGWHVILFHLAALPRYTSVRQDASKSEERVTGGGEEVSCDMS